MIISFVCFANACRVAHLGVVMLDEFSVRFVPVIRLEQNHGIIPANNGEISIFFSQG